MFGAVACTPLPGAMFLGTACTQQARTFDRGLLPIKHHWPIAAGPSTAVPQEWAHLGDLSAEVVAQYDEGAIDEQGVEERMCDAVMYFVSRGGLGGCLCGARACVCWERSGCAGGCRSKHLCAPGLRAGQLWGVALSPAALPPTRLPPLPRAQAILGGLLLLHKPDVIQRLLEHTRLPGESDEAATARWAAVADGMGVSREQAVHMVPLFETYQERMAALSQATAASMETLREVQEVRRRVALLPPAGPTHGAALPAQLPLLHLAPL